MANGLENLTGVPKLLSGWLEEMGIPLPEIDKNKNKTLEPGEVISSVLQYLPKFGKEWKKEVQDPKALSKDLVTQGDAFEKTASDLSDQGKAADAKDYHVFAQRTYQLAVEMDGDNPTARFKLAQSLYQNADPKNAKQNYREARLHLQVAIKNEVDLTQLIETAKLMEKFDQKGFPDAWDEVGIRLVENGKFKEAKEFYRAASTRFNAVADEARQLGGEAQAQKYATRADDYNDKSLIAE